MRRSRQILYDQNTQKLELLLTPLNRLQVKIEGTVLEDAVRIVKADMKRVRIRKLQPHFYLSTGYGTVAGTTSIALGFYDCNTMLQELSYEARGFRYSNAEIVSIVRHELGHAFSYAYKLYRRKDFREVFKVKGNYFNTYPMTERYIERANPWSRDYVNPSGDHYAQKHPDDDFAETFLVWIQPRYNWRRHYRNYPGALRKLEFVDYIVNELRLEEPVIDQKPEPFEPLDEFTETLAQFLRMRSTQKYRRRATGFVDPDLKKMFWRPASTRARRKLKTDYVAASTFIRQHKRDLANQISKWVPVEAAVVKDFVEKCSGRAQILDLWVRKGDEEKKLVDLVSYVAHRCSVYAKHERFFNGK